MAADRRASHSLAVARTLPIDTAYLRRVVETLSSIGSSPLGFRATGTPEDLAVAEFVAGEMRELGLRDVAIEPVTVDGWRFLGASVTVQGGARYEGASMGGVPPTVDGGIVARLVDAGNGERRRLDRMAVDGCVVLVDWTTAGLGPSAVGLELGLRGALGMLVNCPPGGPYYQSDGVLGSFDSHWHREAPPMITVRKEDAAELRRALAAGDVDVRLELDVELAPGTAGHNVVGYLEGDDPSPPLVVGAHHDGWFRASFDDASGVAAMLMLARSLASLGHRPARSICFTSRTAEEYGHQGTAYDWCAGVWGQISETHRSWGASVPFHLCIDATGHPGLRLNLETPPELAGFSRAVCRVGKAEGWLTSGWRLGPPVSGTEQWPFLLAGVPGVATYSWESSFAKSDYHTTRDTIELLDFEHLGRMVRLYSLLLLEADRDPGGILDHAARSRDVLKAASSLGDAGEALRAAAASHAGAHGRDAFTRIGHGLHALDAHGATCYPHVQAERDIEALRRGLAALREGMLAATARALATVGDNALARRLSAEAFAIEHARTQPQFEKLSWAARCHLTASPNLWDELASLRGESGSRASGVWIERSLERHIESSEADLTRRLAAMARALTG